jgi:hypothetical protein
MKWAYRQYSVEPSTICPSGIISRPEAKLCIRGTKGEAYVRPLIDTGADHTIVPFSIANDVGAELFSNVLEWARGLGGHEISVVPGRVDLELIGEDINFRWHAIIGFARFSTPEDECCILGPAGCLEQFVTMFDGPRELVEMHRDEDA